MKKQGLSDDGVTVANPSRGCSMIFEGLPNASSTGHGARSAAATELRRSRCCDGAAQTSSVALQDADNAERAPACWPSAGPPRAQCRPVTAFGRHSRAQ